MRTRIELQPTTTVTSIQTQETRFAAQLGSAKTASVFINVISRTGSSQLDLVLETATSPDLGDDDFWANAGTTVTIATGFTGVKPVALTGLADLLRWRFSSFPSSNTILFNIIVFTADT